MTPSVLLEPRVTTLEELMAQLLVTVAQTDRQLAQNARQQAQTDRQLAQTDRQLAQTDRRLNLLSEEMREFKEEMREFKNEMREFKKEMSEFKNEMREFKNEMREYKEESRRETQKMRQQWGELSNRLGTMVEDLVAPSIGRILRTVVNCPEEQIDTIAIRVRQRRPSDNQQREFDALARCGEYLLVNETKSRLGSEDIMAFAQFLPEVRTDFPRYADRKIIGAIASLYVDESLVRCGERLGLIVLGFGEDVMDILNTPDFKPKEF